MDLERIRMNNNKDLDIPINQVIKYFSSKELNDLKFGSILLNNFFTNLIEVNEELNKNLLYFLFLY